MVRSRIPLVALMGAAMGCTQDAAAPDAAYEDDGPSLLQRLKGESASKGGSVRALTPEERASLFPRPIPVPEGMRAQAPAAPEPSDGGSAPPDYAEQRRQQYAQRMQQLQEDAARRDAGIERTDHPGGGKGSGVIRHLGLTYDNVLYVSGLSKAYSSLAAFIGCPRKLKPFLKCNVTSYLVSGPVPTASLATALAGLELNAREGDTWRRTLYDYTRAILDAYRERGIPTDNDTAFPIVSAYVGSAENVERGGQLLFEEGINVTLQGYPLVPRDKGVLRATPTVANTWDEVEQLITAVGRVHRTLTAR